jgi:transcriptional regulator with XRE-family HTH domain
MQHGNSFGNLIRKVRHNRAEPLRIVAAAIEIDSTLLSKLERGERFPTETQMAKFARYFKIPEHELRARVIAERIISKCDDEDAALYAAEILREQAILCRTQ